MQRLIPTICLIVLNLCYSASANAQENPIVARMQAFAAAFNAGDAGQVSTFYTEQSALFPPQMENVVGRAAIAQVYAGAFKAGVTDLRFKVLEIRQYGDAAVEIGETVSKVGGRDIRARYLHVWKLENGVWMLSRDIYNVIGPAE